MFMAFDDETRVEDHLYRLRKRGVVRVPFRCSRCPKCGETWDSVGTEGYFCPHCRTTPARFYLDIHYKGKRVKIYCDGQGKALDSNQRAYDLLAHVNYEIQNHTFDPSKYSKAEQKEFYADVKLDEYLHDKIGSIAPSYKTHFERYVGIAKDFFGTKDVRTIRKVDLINYQRHLEQNFKVGNKTIKDIMDRFKAFLNYLRKDLEIIAVVPHFPEIEIETKPIKWIHQEDQPALFELIPDAHKPIMGFIMLHGCRPSEARALKCKNVDLQNKTITIAATFSGNVYREKRKGKKSRPVTIPMHQELFDYIADRVRNNLPEAFLFTNLNTGNHYCENKIARVWNDVREKVGMDKSVRFYDASRHSFASNLLVKGSGLYQVSKLLGHSSIKMTEKYAHMEVETLRPDSQKLTLNRPQTGLDKVELLKK